MGRIVKGVLYQMKNADMKVIAIILSIALLFTLFTCNAASVASVVLMFLGGNGTTVVDGAATDDGAQQGVQQGVQQGTQQQGTQQQGTTPDAGATDNADIDAFAFYSKAANEIHTKGIAGYNKISWQTPLKIEGLGLLDGVIVPILENFMTTEDEAKPSNNAKGSDDAKHRMPASNASAQWIKSANAQKNGDNYIITIVLADATNPSYDDTDGYPLMTREFLDYKDVEKEAKNISIVKSLEGEIVYKDYTITAEMTADGKFISITHKGIGYMKANINGSINANGEFEFIAKYTDFVY